MDPIANVREQRDLAAGIIATIDAGEGVGIDRDAVVDLAGDLADRVQALDEWRRKGGFDPYTAEPGDEDTGMAVEMLGVTARICRSAGADKAPVVFVDTDEDLEGDADSPGPRIRIRLNDHALYVGVEHESAETTDASPIEADPTNTQGSEL